MNIRRNQYFLVSLAHLPNTLEMKLERLILYTVLQATRKLNENVNEDCFVSPKLRREVCAILNLCNLVFVAIHTYSVTVGLFCFIIYNPRQ